MEIVVVLAFAILVAVFIFSLIFCMMMKNVCCFGKHNVPETSPSLKFSTLQLLQQDNLDDIILFGPNIAQTLSENQWLDGITGILQHCVEILKLCHQLAETLGKIPDDQINKKFRNSICKRSIRITPRFNALLKSMKSEQVDIVVIEARVSSLVDACWALVTLYLTSDTECNETIQRIIENMDYHHRNLGQPGSSFAENEVRLSNGDVNVQNVNAKFIDEGPSQSSDGINKKLDLNGNLAKYKRISAKDADVETSFIGSNEESVNPDIT